MQIETKAVSVDFKASNDGATIEGMAAVFNNIDSGRDIIHPNAFDRTREKFLDRGFLALFHDWERPIGKPTDATVTGAGLFVGGRISDTPDGKMARTLAVDRVIQGLSIGYTVPKGGAEVLEREQDVEDYWRDIRWNPTPDDLMAKRGGHVRLLKTLDLYEVSPVPVPMNGLAYITMAKAMKSLPAGLTFEAHSESVLAAVEEFKARAAELAELRAKDGRTLSAARIAQLKRLRDDLDALLSIAPARDPAEELYAQFQRTTARLFGVPV